MAKRNDLPTVSLARIADNPPQRKRKNNQRARNVAPVGGNDADRLTYLSRNHRVRWWAAVDSNHLPPRYQHGALPVELAAQGFSKGKPRAKSGEAELYHGHDSPLRRAYGSQPVSLRRRSCSRASRGTSTSGWKPPGTAAGHARRHPHVPLVV